MDGSEDSNAVRMPEWPVMLCHRTLICAVLPVIVAAGAEIVLPGPGLERTGTGAAIYRSNQLATGKGELSIRWTDTYGRVIDDRRVPVQLTDENEIAFSLNLQRVVAMKNEVKVRFSFDGVNKKGVRDQLRDILTGMVKQAEFEVF
jgi:hypothetical protein